MQPQREFAIYGIPGTGQDGAQAVAAVINIFYTSFKCRVIYCLFRWSVSLVQYHRVRNVRHISVHQLPHDTQSTGNGLQKDERKKSIGAPAPASGSYRLDYCFTTLRRKVYLAVRRSCVCVCVYLQVFVFAREIASGGGSGYDLPSTD